MTRWKNGEEHELIDLVQQGQGIEELAEHFHRSSEAIRLKVRRLGLSIPETIKGGSSTTTPQLAPLKATEDLISPEEALKMWLGCVKRLNEPGLGTLELKRIRLVLSALRNYIIVSAEYVERIAQIEKDLDKFRDDFIDYFTVEYHRATTEEEKEMWQKKIDELKAERDRDIEWMNKPFRIWSRRADLRDRDRRVVVRLPGTIKVRSRKEHER